MAFEYYHRNGTKMLRYGYTTGTCAALAAAAATRILLSDMRPDSKRSAEPDAEHKDGPGTQTLMTAKGIPVSVQINVWGREETGAWASVFKDAGDDSDVTDGLEIRAFASKHMEMSGTENGAAKVWIDGGKGIGRVTKPGLDQPIGNAAINSGPRAAITKAVQAVCDEMGYEGGIDIIISAPEGEQAAEKTFNSKLGIEGGISILGTTGIVEPMSEQALVDTIEIELKQTALQSDRLILTPGNYGETFIAEHRLDQMGVPIQKFSNFLGETLDILSGLGFKEVLLIAHVGKLSKVAAGIMNTHSKYADGRNEIFVAHGAICGADTETCQALMHAATTDACIDILDQAGEGEDFRQTVLDSIMDSVQQKLDHRVKGSFHIGALMFSNVYGQLGITEEAKAILKNWNHTPEETGENHSDRNKEEDK